jgi:predicted MPP superfamily phosphohydrolase
LLALVGIVGSAALAYATIVEPRRLQTVTYTLLVPNLPPSLAGLRIAHLTDFHVGMPGTPPAILAKAVAQAEAWQPDLALLTGDFVHRGRWLAEADIFRGLAECVPTFAVLGNHDSRRSRRETDRIAAALGDSGVTVLRNRSVTIAFPDRGEVVLVGVDDPSFRRDDLERAMAGLQPNQTRPARRSSLPTPRRSPIAPQRVASPLSSAATPTAANSDSPPSSTARSSTSA